jgi:hypothetical protein
MSQSDFSIAVLGMALPLSYVSNSVGLFWACFSSLCWVWNLVCGDGGWLTVCEELSTVPGAEHKLFLKNQHCHSLKYARQWAISRCFLFAQLFELPRGHKKHRLHTHVYCGTIHNSQVMETAKMPHHWRMD